MENQQSSAKSLMLNYGLALGIVSIIIALVNFSFGDIYDPHWGVTVISIIATSSIIVYAFKVFKNSNKGFLALGTALKIGMGIVLVSTILYLIYFFVFTKFIEPEFFANLLNLKEQEMIDANMSDDQIETSKSFMENYLPLIVYVSIVALSLFLGFLISLVGGLIMKKSEE